MSTAAEKRYTVDEYLALEEVSEIKHEFFNGEIFTMSGGTESHSLIGSNLVRELGNALKGRGCRVYQSAMPTLGCSVPLTKIYANVTLASE